MSFGMVRARKLFCPKKLNTNFHIEITSIFTEFFTLRRFCIILLT